MPTPRLGIVAIVPLLASSALLASSTLAATSVSIDDASRGLRIEVDDDAPQVIHLKSDDILPIRWDRQGVRGAILPAIAIRRQSDLTIVDDSSNAYALARRDVLPQILFDSARYARDTNWHGQPSVEQRRRYVTLGVLFSLGLLLVLLVRRYVLVAAFGYCLAWSVGLLIAISSRPAVIWDSIHAELPVMRVYAREEQPLRVPIGPGLCIPIVESPAHLRALSPRVEVRREEAELVVDLPKNAKLFLTSMTYAQELLEDQTR